MSMSAECENGWHKRCPANGRVDHTCSCACHWDDDDEPRD